MFPTIITTLDRAWTLTLERPADGAPLLAPLPAQVPGCVFTDLQVAGVLPDPLGEAGDHQWVAESDWRYSTTFEVGADHIPHEHLELKFEGLDTLATVLVNGNLIGRTANMHRRHRFDATPAILPGTNQLDIVFESAIRHAEALRIEHGDWPSSSFDRPFNYLRKMACSWGSELSLPTIGISRPVTFHAWSGARLSDIRTHASVDDDDQGQLDVEIVTIGSRVGVDRLIRCTLLDPDGRTVASETVPFVAGGTWCRLDAGRVRRWWPHTHGDQPLYDLHVELVHPDGCLRERKSVRVGFRTVELDTSADERGSQFTLVVNGRPVFARGANWVPEALYSGSVPTERYRERLEQVRAAHLDVLRAWGGGGYEDDRFYDLCDELGILVWQDFALTRAAYPEHLLAGEVEAEAVCNISRLMRHPSLALWNGNNEGIWGAWDWGWSHALRGRPWGAGFYHDLLPRLCAEIDPLRPYWPGSPYSGSEHVTPNADAHGCVHVRDDWDNYDLQRYRDRSPRFVAKFGWQSPPTPSTLVAGRDPGRTVGAYRDHLRAYDPELELGRGVRTRFGAIDDPDAFVFAAHVVQARAASTGMEHFRSLRPWCMGALWSHFNDRGSRTSWSVVDGEGRPKPAYHALARASRPRLLTLQPRGDRLVLFAINDTDRPWQVDTVASRRCVDGSLLATAPVATEVAPWSAAMVPLPHHVTEPDDPSAEVVVVGEGPDRAWWWYANDLELALLLPRLDTEARTDDDAIVLTVTPDVMVREFTIYPDRIRADASVDRQAVDLLPGEAAAFRITGIGIGEVDALIEQPACWSIADVLIRDRVRHA